MRISDRRWHAVSAYEYTITWTTDDGCLIEATHKGGPATAEQCQAAWSNLIRDAYAFGYTKPKWWQWWRRGDSVIDHPDEQNITDLA